MPLKIYISPFSSGLETDTTSYADFIGQLEADGHEATFTNPADWNDDAKTLDEHAADCFQAIKDADVFVAMCRGGQAPNAEIGMAAGMEKFSILVRDEEPDEYDWPGDPDLVTFLPNVKWVDSLAEARSEIKKWEILMSSMGSGSFLSTSAGFARLVTVGALFDEDTPIPMPNVEGGIGALFFTMMVSVRESEGEFPPELMKGLLQAGFNNSSLVCVGTSFEAIFHELKRTMVPRFQEQVEQHAEALRAAGNGATVSTPPPGSVPLPEVPPNGESKGA